jgi:hypothetical protein
LGGRIHVQENPFILPPPRPGAHFCTTTWHCLAAIDMFVVVTATFRLLYALVVLGHDRRKVTHFEVTEIPTQDWLARQVTEAFPWDTAPRYLLGIGMHHMVRPSATASRRWASKRLLPRLDHLRP